MNDQSDYRRALDFEASLTALQACSERRAWQVAFAAVIVAIGSVAALAVMMPFYRVVPLPIEVNKLADAPERVKRSYLRAGGQYFLKDAPYSLAFEDRGRYLVTTHTHTDIVASMMDLVQAKAWTRIRVSGHGAFCREVWLQAASIGIEVSGYTPKPAELARLAELNGPTEHTRDRDSEHLALQPQAATTATPAGAGRVAMYQRAGPCPGVHRQSMDCCVNSRSSDRRAAIGKPGDDAACGIESAARRDSYAAG
ncbi:VirB8/TrbF family protein [Burkholderia lata]|uniref:VirB8/TrbF family protein n=1 Tax=Burkholderia lata (strain ATCC 17760 / DSM 23089 / LMG 22485 / NCIMB 9086 / R18194 / 383) TaxID=482957 RepID=UPI001E2A882D|nr:VirB8/TrbF family protein [Burkholderia lata]